MYVVLLAALSAFLFLRLFIPFFHRHLLDQPNARSSHYQPIPRGGGLSFVVVASAASGIAFIAGQTSVASLSPLIAFPLAVVGFFDDLYDLPALWRYVAQLLTAVLVVAFSLPVQGLALSIASASCLLLPILILIVIAVSAVINFTNFMDGLDGLVAGCMAVAISTCALKLSHPWPIWALVGALLGFLLWNWSPAKVFMGDVGSTFLGAIFACLSLQASTWQVAFGLLLVATPLLGDAFLCVARRCLAGQRVFQAHRLHLFQRLHQAGWCHAHVSSLYIAATVVLAIAHLAGGLAWVIGFALAVLLIGVWLDQHVAVGFAVASKS